MTNQCENTKTAGHFNHNSTGFLGRMLEAIATTAWEVEPQKPRIRWQAD